MKRRLLNNRDGFPYSRFATLFAALTVALSGCNADQRAGSLPSTTISQGTAIHDETQSLPRRGVNSQYGVLYNFGSQGPGDGLEPAASLTIDTNSNDLYGTTVAGGNYSNNGAIIKLTPPQKPSGKYSEKVLYSFSGYSDGGTPHGQLILVNGKLYGTTSTGGYSTACKGGCGTVFEINPSNGKLLNHYQFQGAPDGATPMGGLAYEQSNNTLYGTTEYGGVNGGCGGSGCGTLFQCTLTLVCQAFYAFQSSSDRPGAFPLSAPIVYHDNGGYGLAGTTSQGGTNSCGASLPQGCGTFFQVFSANSYWYTVSYSFGGSSVSGVHDGIYPVGGVVDLSTTGNDIFAGTTEYGGSTFPKGSNHLGYGTVFVVTKGTSPTDVIIHSFAGTNGNWDGSHPIGGLVLSARGALYGTTQDGGQNDLGTAYKVSSKYPYAENVFYSFSTKLGKYPQAGFTVGAGTSPALFGTTVGGGTKGHGVANIFHNEFH